MATFHKIENQRKTIIFNIATMIVRRSEKIPSVWLLGAVFIAYYVSFSDNNLKTSPSFVAARPLNSIQLATGEWDVLIRGGFWMDASRIFPSVYNSQVPPSSFARRTQKSKSKIDEISVPFVKRRLWGASLDCILSLAPDGTFVLTPKRMETTADDEDDHSPSNGRKEGISVKNSMLTKGGKRTKTTTTTTTTGVLDLRGSWNVLANPYCVTDRLYDQVSLTSYPRQKIGTRKGNRTTAATATEESVLRTIHLTMNCRMWGRHNRQSRQRYRMTHGTLVCRKHDVPWWKQLHRPVLASFSAVRSSNKPKHEGWIDKEHFGY